VIAVPGGKKVSATDRLEPEVLDSPIRGSGLTAENLREEIGGRRTLLCFLRHFG
jgi:hypothetical protein